MTTFRGVAHSILLCVFAGIAFSGFAESPDPPLNNHEIAWSQFASQVLKLHHKLVGSVPVVIKTRVGGYAHQPAFYREVSYFNAKTHKLISRVRWEKAHPKRLHTIEVYLYDKQGRVKRDYTAAYLPNYYRSPTQTLISFYAYHGGLHAFRTFDADGYRIVEECGGQYQGRLVEIVLDEDEIADGTPEMHTAAYQACFAGMRLKPGKYLTPH